MLLALYQPTACGPMVCVAEDQQYDHKNIYHWTLDFICHFIDSKGSWYDPAAGKYIYSTPPTGLDIEVSDISNRSVMITEGFQAILGETGQNVIVPE